eukprot:SAG31_NODE_36198_length_315_cov_1.231481_1_plen_42_part_00
MGTGTKFNYEVKESTTGTAVRLYTAVEDSFYNFKLYTTSSI